MTKVYKGSVAQQLPMIGVTEKGIVSLGIGRIEFPAGYRTIQDLACCLDSGTPATQAQVRSVLFAEPETFYQMEDWWDLAIFHRFEGQAFHGKGKGGFDERKFLGRVLSEALRAKGTPIQLKMLAEKYLLKIRNRMGLPEASSPGAAARSSNGSGAISKATPIFTSCTTIARSASGRHQSGWNRPNLRRSLPWPIVCRTTSLTRQPCTWRSAARSLFACWRSSKPCSA